MVKAGPMPRGDHNKVESEKLHKLGRFPKLRAAGRAAGKAFSMEAFGGVQPLPSHWLFRCPEYPDVRARGTILRFPGVYQWNAKESPKARSRKQGLCWTPTPVLSICRPSMWPV